VRLGAEENRKALIFTGGKGGKKKGDLSLLLRVECCIAHNKQKFPTSSCGLEKKKKNCASDQGVIQTRGEQEGGKRGEEVYYSPVSFHKEKGKLEIYRVYRAKKGTARRQVEGGEKKKAGRLKSAPSNGFEKLRGLDLEGFQKIGGSERKFFLRRSPCNVPKGKKGRFKRDDGGP